TFPALENDAACRQCGFVIEMAEQQFGIPAMLDRPVADLAEVLDSGEQRAISAAVQSLEQRFPQIKASVVLAAAPPNVPIAVYALWLFNRGSLFSAVEKAGDNHGILLLIDTARRHALLMPGYGLEPFVPESALKLCLDAATAALNKAGYANAAVTCLDELERQLTRICEGLPEIFGYDGEQDSSSGTAEAEDPF
ncbi:MAG: TPM domain-containing protein, partial [Prosthecobacter sp.]|nr:TPM domain-containing protein [Prosthecobacter sp.]